MSRARLAVFVAAAIVFAPGAGPGDGSPQKPGSDVAARMLAPTFDEPQVAAYPSATLAKKAKEQARRLSGALLALALLVGAACLPEPRGGLFLGQRIQRFGRHVATRHRDRGPPHLQLA